MCGGCTLYDPNLNSFNDRINLEHSVTGVVHIGTQ